MPTSPSPPTLVAVDTNVLLDCACGEESVLDALATIRRRIRAVQMVVSPTVLEELGAILLTGDAHLRGLDHEKVRLELKACDVEVPIIATPREIVAKFY